MQGYEIRLINRSGDLSLQLAQGHLSDLIAIRAARKICREGETTEVWREDVCVYRGRLKSTPLVWPVISEKVAG